jgi:hypothetical protein
LFRICQTFSWQLPESGFSLLNCPIYPWLPANFWGFSANQKHNYSLPNLAGFAFCVAILESST